MVQAVAMAAPAAERLVVVVLVGKTLAVMSVPGWEPAIAVRRIR